MAIKKKVYIEVGHGGTDSGANGNGFKEKDLNLIVALELMRILVALGFDVKISRTTDILKSIAEMCSEANAWGAVIKIAIHHNAGGGHGSEVIYQVNDGESLRLAQLIDKYFKATGQEGHGERSVYTRVNTSNTNYYGSLRMGKMDSVITEYGFIDTDDVKAFDTNLELLNEALAISKGVCDFFGVGHYIKSEGTVVEDVNTLLQIMGEGKLSRAQMVKFLLIANPTPKLTCTPVELMASIIGESKIEGVNHDIVFAQQIKETGYYKYGGQVAWDQNNFCGLGATNGGAKGATFEVHSMGVRAQVQHLKAYASTEPLKLACVDPRFNLVKRGYAPYLEHLGLMENPKNRELILAKKTGTIGWAVPGGKWDANNNLIESTGYGHTIRAIINSAMKVVAEPVDVVVEPPDIVDVPPIVVDSDTSVKYAELTVEFNKLLLANKSLNETMLSYKQKVDSLTTEKEAIKLEFSEYKKRVITASLSAN